MSDSEQTTALAKREPSAGSGLVLRTMDDHKQFGMALFHAGLVSGDKHEAVAKAVIAIQCGAELGIGPMSSIRGIFVMDGKPVMSAGLMSALIKRSGRYNYRVLRHTECECSIEFFERGSACGVSAFTMDDARRAGVAFKTRKGLDSNWTKFPRNMLFARALSNGARWYCPDLFSGAVYTADELSGGAIIDAEIVRDDSETDAEIVRDDSETDAETHPFDDSPAEPEQRQHREESWPRDARGYGLTDNHIGRLRGLMAEACKLERTGKIRQALADALNDSSLTGRAAGALIKRSYDALGKLGWSEPAEWADARAARKARETAGVDRELIDDEKCARAEEQGAWDAISTVIAWDERLKHVGYDEHAECRARLRELWSAMRKDPSAVAHSELEDAIATARRLVEGDPGEPPEDEVTE